MLVVFITLILALILFAWGKWRHDIVAVICLLALTLAGVIPPHDAFLGFGHPAVITVAAVLVVSRGLQHSGLIDTLGHFIMKMGKNRTLQIGVLCMVVCLASAFMNNVGALAVIIPVAIHLARQNGYSPSYVLMPVAFASLLGGMTTLIGTPPNILVSAFRAETLAEPYAMFDFSPVGVVLAATGLTFIALAGWRLLPKRESADETEKFNIEDYITEVEVLEESSINGLKVYEIEEKTQSDIRVLNVIRNGRLIQTPSGNLKLKTGDIVTVEAESEELKKFIESSKTKLVGKEELQVDADSVEDLQVVEAVVMNDSSILGRTASGLRMRSRFAVNLLAISRQDQQIRRRIDHVAFRVGDVLLLQGFRSQLADTLRYMGCLPLADRDFTIGRAKDLLPALTIFMLGLTGVITGILDVQVAFTMSALLMVIFKVVPVREVYNAIDWPVIVLLGALLPVGQALETTGGATLIANYLLGWGTQLSPEMMLILLLVGTMFLSDIINNAATVVIMAPVAVHVAHGLQVSVDPFLMAVAVGSSCAFLTPIGHQSNTLVMGPGGYKFTDYWRMGLPLEILIVAAGVPAILYFWPL